MSLDPVTVVRSDRYQAWKKMLENPDCEAAFRRMLQAGTNQIFHYKIEIYVTIIFFCQCVVIFNFCFFYSGIITHMYDHFMFPTPDSLKEKYQVTDEKNGYKKK